MDMIRWLATNKVVMAVWGLGILAILLASIFGGGKKADQDTVAVETKTVEAVVEKAKPATAAIATTAVVATAAVASTVQAAVDTSAEVEEASAEVEVKAADATTEAPVAEKSEEAATETAVTTSEASSEKPEVAVKEDDLTDKSSDDLLMMAREAYWDNGLDKAAGLYAELITREPSVIEHKGELGNVFWRQGYPKKAAELYADIAEPMIAKGNGERVSNMVGFISLFFPERAGTIRKLLDAQ